MKSASSDQTSSPVCTSVLLHWLLCLLTVVSSVLWRTVVLWRLSVVCQQTVVCWLLCLLTVAYCLLTCFHCCFHCLLRLLMLCLLTVLSADVASTDCRLLMNSLTVPFNDCSFYWCLFTDWLLRLPTAVAAGMWHIWWRGSRGVQSEESPSNCRRRRERGGITMYQRSVKASSQFSPNTEILKWMQS